MKCAAICFLLFIAAQSVTSQRETWWQGGVCGISKFEDAGYPEPGYTRIVGGEEAREHEFPWMASISSGLIGSSHYCGGTILNPEWVLTSSFCVDGRALNTLSVTVGEHDLSSGGPGSTSQTYDVSYVFMHEEYNKYSSLDADIALIKVAGSIEFSEDVTAVCAPDMSTDYTQNQEVLVAGWGSSNSTEPCCEDILHYAHVNTMDRPTCQAYPNIAATVTEGMICAADEDLSRDACFGDGGGPLVYKTAADFELVGVTSWGYLCAEDNPRVYANVQKYATWITAKIEKN